MAVERSIDCSSCSNPFQLSNVVIFRLSLQGFNYLALTLLGELSYAAYTGVVYFKEKKPNPNHFANGHLVRILCRSVLGRQQT